MVNARVQVSKDISNRTITIERVLNLPRELIWEAWTKPEHIAGWWGPAGWVTRVHRMDVRPGGAWHFSMQPDDRSADPIWGLAVYTDVSAPSRLSYVESFSNEAGDVTDIDRRNITVDFVEDSPLQTKLVICTQFSSAATLEAMEIRGMASGYAETLSRLEALVSRDEGVP